MKNVNIIADRLTERGFEAYLVGGAIRDKLLGVKVIDYDIATNATPTQVQKLFSDKKTCTVGKCYMIVVVDGVEVATYRVDRQLKNFSNKCCQPVYAKTIEEDLSRRDLTINAMALKYPFLPFNVDNIIDPFGGVKDLSNGVIRFVGDPEERIKQDPNRIIRACRFLAKIEGSFEKETFVTLKKYAYAIEKYVDPERIRKEILKAMEVGTPSMFFSALHIIGALKYIFPEMDKCFHHTGGKYHLETIGEHCMLTGDNISPKFPLLRLAGFLHDIGKPKAYSKWQDGSFKNHEIVGGKLAEKYLRNLKFSNKEIKYITNLVYAHMRTCRGLTPKASRRLIKYLADNGVNPRDYLRLKIADRLGNVTKSNSRITPIKELIYGCGINNKDKDLPLTVKDLAIRGGELIEYLGIEPGPLVGKIQRKLLDFVINNGEKSNTIDILKREAKKCL